MLEKRFVSLRVIARSFDTNRNFNAGSEDVATRIAPFKVRAERLAVS